LKNIAEASGVSSSVIFTGLVDYEQLPDYYCASDVCAFPSFYESFGLVPLESLACGTPVVATKVGDLQNIIHEGKTGYILDNGQPEILADKLKTILSGNQPFLQDSQSIRNSVACFDWDNIASLIEAQFRCLVAENEFTGIKTRLQHG
jgi:D-inositol-3-phosphate glycosyltransferase